MQPVDRPFRALRIRFTDSPRHKRHRAPSGVVGHFLALRAARSQRRLSRRYETFRGIAAFGDRVTTGLAFGSALSLVRGTIAHHERFARKLEN